MKTDVSTTSIISYYGLDLGERQFEVASAIRDLKVVTSPLVVNLSVNI
jgi:hypothetical protein